MSGTLMSSTGWLRVATISPLHGLVLASSVCNHGGLDVEASCGFLLSVINNDTQQTWAHYC